MDPAFNIETRQVAKQGCLRELITDEQLALRWLGQAGFEVYYQGVYLMIDPYLSDFLAQKYKGKEFPHKRMMPAPVKPEEVRGLGWMLCTHKHSDHTDPLTLPILLRNNPRCKMVAPAAEREHILSLGLSESQILFVNAGRSYELTGDITLEVIPSAHEEVRTNAEGEHHFLGYILRLNAIRIYHSGDCILYGDLKKELKERKINVALLPINGRGRGVDGNFTVDEAVGLCSEANIPVMICHHFGMFAFNTVDKDWLVGKAKTLSKDGFACIVPDVAALYKVG